MKTQKGDFMIHRTHLTCLCTIIICLSQTISGTSSEITFNSVEEVMVFLNKKVKNTRAAIEKIVQIPLEERTFQNTIKAWNELVHELRNTAIIMASIDYPVMVQHWHTFVGSAVFQNDDLIHALITYAQNPPDASTLNPDEQRALQQFLPVASRTYTEFKGLAENKNSPIEASSNEGTESGNAEGGDERAGDPV